MTELIDKVARGLRNESLAIFGSAWDTDASRRLARAAIKAAREPTSEMCLNGADAADSLTSHGAKHVWQAMVDNAAMK